MKQIRFLIIGIVIGGAFGAKTGAYLTQFFDTQSGFELVEFGFVIGAGIGLFSSFIFQLMHAGFFKLHKRPHEKRQIAVLNS